MTDAPEALPPLTDEEVRHIARTTPMGGSNRERDANLIRAGFEVGISAALAQRQQQQGHRGDVPPWPGMEGPDDDDDDPQPTSPVMPVAPAAV